jgi:hypothetical protein
MRRSFTLTLVLVLTLGWVGIVRAQDAAPELRVATFVVPPFVMRDGDRLVAFSIDFGKKSRRGSR